MNDGDTQYSRTGRYSFPAAVMAIGLRSRMIAHSYQWLLIGMLSLVCVPAHLTLSGQPADGTIATYDGIVALSASYNGDDHYSVVLAATKSGDVHEIFYSNLGIDKMPVSHGDSVIAHFDGIVGLAGFYNMDDSYRVAIVATNSGDVHEVFYHPTKGRGDSVIAHYDGIISIAGFFNRDDKYRVVLIATGDGNVHEVFYNPSKGKGQDLLAHYDGLLAIAGTFFEGSNDRCLVALTANGTAQLLLYNPNRPPERKTFNFLPRTSRSVAITGQMLVVGTSDGTLLRYALLPSDKTQILSTATETGIAGLRYVAVDYASAANIVYSTDDGRVRKFLPPPIPPPPTPPTITTFKASPNMGHINVGDTATLTWATANCGQDCTVSMVGKDGVNYGDPLMSAHSLSASGSLKVTPSRSTLTKYVLTARSPAGQDSKEVVVTLYRAPGPPSGSIFYLRMRGGTNAVTPCFTLAIFAANQNQAEQLAESQNGGYTAEPITYAEFANGC